MVKKLRNLFSLLKRHFKLIVHFPLYLNAYFNPRCSFIYSVTSSGPEENVGRIGTSLTSGRTCNPDDVRTTAERATLSEP